MRLAFRLAARDLRGGIAGLRIVLVCLALGVGAVAAIGSLRAAVDAGLAANGARMLGGDIAVAGAAEPLPDSLRSWLTGQGARVSDIVQMRSMLVAGSGERQLVELKAVDPAWPLVGAARLEPPQPVAEALVERNGRFGLVAEPVLLDRLRLKPGDTARIGNATFEVRGVLAEEPDRVATSSLFGPRVLIAAAALPATGLIQPGSLLHYELRARLPGGVDPAPVEAKLRARFPDRGWRIRDAGHAVPGAERLLDQTSVFMSLVGLTALLVSGVGIANGVRSWLAARARTIATLRCLGASRRLVFQVCAVEVMALLALGIAAGLLVGAVLPLVAIRLLGGVLPVPPRAGVYPGPLALAALYGILTAACFSLWPLGRAMRIPGAVLFRDGLVPGNGRPSGGLLLANLLLAASLIAVTVLTTSDRGFAGWFSAAAVATLVLFRIGAFAVERLAAFAPYLRRPSARLGLANLGRPGAPTAMVLVSLGLGLTTLVSVALIEGNLRRQVAERMPANAPSFYFIDIQPDQLPSFNAILKSEPGARGLHEVPNLRARVVAVNGVPADQVHASPETAWALRGDRGLTYAASPPEGTKLTAGSWWPADYAGSPLVSFDAKLAQGWGVHVGDTITLNVLGRDIPLRVASLRDIDWESLSLNFAMLASPGMLEHAPHGIVATVRIDPARQGALLRAVTDALPNVTGILVADVLRTIAGLLAQIAAALRATGLLTLAAGVLVLSGAVAAAQRVRTLEAVILKTLGATRRQILAAWLVEFGVLGASAGLIAGAIGTAVSFWVMRHLLETDWVFLPGVLALTELGAIMLTLVLGYASVGAALRAKPAALLRNE